MSYARWGADSDVYVFVSVYGGIECCGCKMGDGSPIFDTSREILDHLEEHRNKQHLVPDYLIDSLIADYPNLDEMILP